jgi:hypothetical protein
VDTGLQTENVAMLAVNTRDVPREERDELHRRLLAALLEVPGVQAAALDIYPPFSGASMIGRVRLAEAPESEPLEPRTTQVTPGWFELLRVQSIAGRNFRMDDWQPGAPRRVVLTAGLARRLFGTSDAIGRRVLTGGAAGAEAEVVGVVGDLRVGGPASDPDDTLFEPYSASTLSSVTILARANSLDTATLDAITKAVERAAPQIPVPAAGPLTDLIDNRVAEQRLFSRMIGLVAALAALLAAIGLYGVVSFTVASRRREMGIRLALGADGRRLARLIGRYAFSIVALGTAAGLAGAYALSRVLESLLFGVSPADPAAYVGSALLFAAVAALASWAPTLAAMRVDPVATLRGE